MRESDVDEEVFASQVDEVTFRNNQITPQESITVVTQNQLTTMLPTHPLPQVITTQQQQRARTVNITYQGASSQVQTASSMDINQSLQSLQRISSSQFQTPSGASYVRITSGQPQMPNIVHGPPGIYIPQGMNIAPIRQPMPVNQSMSQQGNRIIINNQIQQGHQIVTGSFQQNPHNLRF